MVAAPPAVLETCLLVDFGDLGPAVRAGDAATPSLLALGGGTVPCTRSAPSSQSIEDGPDLFGQSGLDAIPRAVHLLVLRSASVSRRPPRRHSSGDEDDRGSMGRHSFRKRSGL